MLLLLFNQPVSSNPTLNLGATEGSDVASFTVDVAGANPDVVLTATEGADTASFTVRNRARVTLGATEAPDVASFAVGVVSAAPTVSLGATESPDIASFSLLNKDAVIPGGHYGAWWLDKYKKMWEKPQIKEIIEEIKENPQIIEEIPEVKAEIIEKYPDFDYQFLQNNIKLQRIVANLIQKQIENAIEEDDLEVLLL